MRSKWWKALSYCSTWNLAFEVHVQPRQIPEATAGFRTLHADLSLPFLPLVWKTLEEGNITGIFFLFLIYCMYMHMGALPVWMPVYHLHVVTLDPLELEPWMVISCFWVLGPLEEQPVISNTKQSSHRVLMKLRVQLTGSIVVSNQSKETHELLK